MAGGEFRIDTKTEKTNPVADDLILIADSEDDLGGIPKNKSCKLTDLLSGGGGVKLQPLFVTTTSAAYTITESANDLFLYCDTSGNDIVVTLPLLANSQDRQLFIKNIGSGLLTVNRTSTDEIWSDGFTSVELTDEGNYMAILGATAHWSSLGLAITSYLKMDGYSGYGSTETAIRRFTELRESTGNLYTENHSTGYNSNTEGLEIEILKSGLWSFSWSGNGAPSTGTSIGFSKNSSQLTTTITTITTTDVIDITSGNINGYLGNVSDTRRYVKGDLVRFHSDKTTPASIIFEYVNVSFVGE